jgi:hypothetical protein
MSTFTLTPTDLKVPCQSFQCFGRAAYLLGKENSPRGTEFIICGECAQELVENILVDFAPMEDNPESNDNQDDMLDGKLIADWTVPELKEKAESLGLTKLSKLNKAELVAAIIEKEQEHE